MPQVWLNKPICRDEIDKYKSTTIIDKYVGRKMKLEVNLFSEKFH